MALDKDRILEINKEAANQYFRELCLGKEKDGLKYLLDRELTPQTIKKYGLGYAPKDKGWYFMTNYLVQKGYTKEELVAAGISKVSPKNPNNIYDTFHDRVMFPIVNIQGKVIGFGGRILEENPKAPKYLNTGETPVFIKGNNLFSMNHAKDSEAEAIVLCEGYMDVIAMNQAGFDEAIATLGTAITPEQARFISLYTDKVICAYDNDDAGNRAKRRAVELLSEQGVEVKVVNMKGIDAKDPDEYIKKYGREQFQTEVLDKAESAVDFLIRDARENLDMNDERTRTEFATRIIKPLKLLPELERNLYIDTLNTQFDIGFGMTSEQAVSELPVNFPEMPSFPTRENQENDLTMLNPETSISSCGLPPHISDELGQGGVMTVGELLGMSADDFRCFFDDTETVKELCKITKTDYFDSRNGFGE